MLSVADFFRILFDQFQNMSVRLVILSFSITKMKLHEITSYSVGNNFHYSHTLSLRNSQAPNLYGFHTRTLGFESHKKSATWIQFCTFVGRVHAVLNFSFIFHTKCSFIIIIAKKISLLLSNLICYYYENLFVFFSFVFSASCWSIFAKSYVKWLLVA
jgi:hypothetical protein